MRLPGHQITGSVFNLLTTVRDCGFSAHAQANTKYFRQI